MSFILISILTYFYISVICELIIYNGLILNIDQSVLEMYHLTEFFKLLNEEKCNIFKNFSDS